MKIKVMLKDPDLSVVRDGQYMDFHTLPEHEQEVVGEFLEYSEYLTIEVDTETRTAIVVKP